MDFLTSLFTSLLGADFPKVAGICGLLFILLGVAPGRLKLGPGKRPGAG